MSGRFGQLSYTSFDAGASSGGWQVKELAGIVDDDETRLLVAGVRTVFEPVEPPPDYPDADQIARLPRRLAYQRMGPGSAGFWHTVPAGVDSTGRPGNVFAHVVLDRMPSAAPLDRPIQWWRSPGWLHPFGPDAVTRASLPHDVPAPTNEVTRETVVAFALNTSTWRLGTLFGLLDAVAGALAGGKPVVLGAESVDSAAQWIGLVSLLMSAGTAGTLNFSTFDRADQVNLAIQTGQHLTAVPAVDLAAVSDDVVLIDETATLSLGEFGGEPHRTAAGQSIAATPWSAMAQVALVDARSAGVVLDDIDAYAARVGDRGLHPAWPMAMSVLTRDEFADARDEANHVLAMESPRGLDRESGIGQVFTNALNALVGTSTADAWRAVQHAPRGGDAAEYANRTYLLRALADDAWLAQLDPIPVASTQDRCAGRAADAGLSKAIDEAYRRALAAGPERVLILVDFLATAGIGDGRIPRSCASDVGAALGDRDVGPVLIQRLGNRIAPVTRMDAATATLYASLHRDGNSTVPHEVLSWFAEGVAVPTPAELSRAQPWDATWVRAAVRGARAQLVGAADAADRFAQAWWLSVCQARGFTRLAARTVWHPTELLVAAGGTGATIGEAALRTLLGTPDSPALLELATAVMHQSYDTTAKACATVRVIDPGAWIGQSNFDELQSSHAPLWDIAVHYVGADHVHADFATRLVTIAAVARICDLPCPRASSTLSADPVVTRTAAANLAALAEGDHVAPVAVIAAAVAARAKDPADVSGSRSGRFRGRDHLDDVLAAAATAVAAARVFTDGDEEAAATIMARSAGTEEDPSTIKRNRKAVHKFIASHRESQPSLASRIWGDR